MPNIDEALVERLAREAFIGWFANCASTEANRKQCEKDAAEKWERRAKLDGSENPDWAAGVRRILTALSETHLIIEKPTGEERDAGKDLALYDAATPGPWEWTEDKWHGGYSGICGPVVDGACLEVLYPDHCNEGDDGAAWFEDSPSEADRRVLTESREIAPYWIKQALIAKRLVAVQAEMIKNLQASQVTGFVNQPEEVPHA